MTLRKASEVRLVLSAGQSIKQLEKGPPQRAETCCDGARIRYSDSMKAHLTGTGFEIEPVTEEIQAVSGQHIAEWRWEVKPTETGDQRLHLTLTAIIVVKGSDKPLVDLRSDARRQRRLDHARLLASSRTTGSGSGRQSWSRS